MKKFKGLLLAVTLMLSADGLMAQSYTETAIMFSRQRPGGSARILGMGGASVSLGGDFTSAYSNPAGLGMYNRSEFSITPGYFQMKTTGNYFGTATVDPDNFIVGSSPIATRQMDTKTSLSIPGFGLIFSKPKGDIGFLRGTFGITVTKLNDFNSNVSYRGVNSTSSLIDYFINEANLAGQQGRVGDPSQFDAGGELFNTITELAYRNFLIGEASVIDPSFPDDAYFTDFDPAINPDVNQRETIETRGGQNQWSFSYGANFNDKFFLGGGIGVVALNFISHKTFSEGFTDQPIRSYTLTEDLQIKGTGINATVGGIFRPIGGLQIGASVTTPTRYNLTDTYRAEMASSWDNFDYYGDGSVILREESEYTDDLVSGYNLMTPWKLNFGASYIFGKTGLLSLDVERLNYGNARYNSQTPDISFEQDNKDIKVEYSARTNVRLGGEVRVNNLRFRAGVGVMPDAAESRPKNVSNTWTTGSLGIGYRKDKFFVDVAYTRLFINGNVKIQDGSVTISGGNPDKNAGSVYRPYTVPNGPALFYDQVGQSFLATVGFTF